MKLRFDPCPVQPLADDDEHLLSLRDGGRCQTVGGSIQLVPPAIILHEAFHTEDISAGGVGEEGRDVLFQLSTGQTQLEEVSRGKSIVRVEVELFAAGLPIAALCDAGHIVAGIDGDPANLYYVRLHQDIRILCRIVRELEGIDLARVFVNGASQGGGLGIATCALNRELINRAAILYPFLSDFRLVWDLDADDIAYEGLRYWSRWFDEDSSRIDEAYAKLAYFDSKNFAPMVKCPVLFGTGTADIVCPPATQFAVYNNLSCDKRHEFFGGFGHEEIQDFDDLIIPFFCEGGEAHV